MKLLIPLRDNRLTTILNSKETEPWEFMYGAKRLISPPFKANWFNTERGTRKTLLRRFLYPFETFFCKAVKTRHPFRNDTGKPRDGPKV